MFDTMYPADSVEFCPHENLQDIFVVGTYKLDQGVAVEGGDDERRNSQHRRGQCRVFRMDVQSNGTDLQTPGTKLGSLVVSLSDGSLSLLRPENGTGPLSVESSWHAHDYEPWIAAWNYWDTNVVFSGGDDLQMKGWDIREDLVKPIFVNKRFDAGITAIQSHPYVENLIAVGRQVHFSSFINLRQQVISSYDNIVRLFDIRKPSVPISQIDVGGGAWRVKWHPSSTRKNDLLVACMHDGFKIVSFSHLLSDNPLNVSAGNGKIVKRFDEHESLAYGVDWSYAMSEGEHTVIASCSFYDHLLHTWSG
ncbi:WD40 repeat-like protein [Guyanagaster necrorhizus]|uniref:WD40 repeat-like protein n=1 Tax=Guyanagaster necrorhizus TaxID=856835 RepID=A0A9P8AWF2_9AGAR|nr:WD40 repeat-like protein [Guyanagaster necrorhizus MCA 3950]KAG7450513.1 WD40 repeat-like protein [Guyanagaster necrorhizus MCA 3950]